MDLDITDCIAIYAAVLSTFVFIWNLNNSRAKITVEIVYGVNEKSKHGIYISIKNPSSHKVYVAGISLVYPYREVKLLGKLKNAWEYKNLNKYKDWIHDNLIFEGLETGLPLSIEPRNSHKIFIPEENLQGILSKCIDNKFAAVVQDALWRNKYSLPFKMKTSTSVAKIVS